MNSAPVTVTDVSWVASLLQAGDASYPTGSYAHSFGLEGLVAAGVVRDPASLQEWISLAVLPALAHVELPLAGHAHRALAAADWPAVAEISELASAVRAPRELREAAEAIGRQRVEFLARLRPRSLAVEHLARGRAGRWPFPSAVAAALEAVVFGAPRTALGAAVGYATLAAVVTAAVKLLRIGQNAAQGLLTGALAELPGLLATAEGLALADIGWANPWLDIASARHESAESRLFIS